MKILKFWGTSMWSAYMINKVSNIVLESYKSEDIIVVVSAMSWITDKLIELTKNIQKKDFKKVKKIFWKIKKHHKKTLKDIVQANKYELIWNEIFWKIFEKLELIIEWTSLVWEFSDKINASILYFWEILSSALLVEVLKMKWIDSKQILSKEYIKTNENYLDWEVDYVKTKNLIKKKLKIEKNLIPVVTWFAWSDEENNVTLLSRWWSDYVATIFWYSLWAKSVEIWTDVAWICSSDPRIIKNPVCFEKLDYKICAELALAWAKVLHPKTILPVIKSRIPIYIKSTMEPNRPWTKICNYKSEWIKWINLSNDNILFHFTDNIMFWRVWYIYKITKIFNENNIPLDSIATSEVSFTCSINKKDFSNKLVKDFNWVWDLKILKNLSKISIVWEKIWFDCSILKDVFNTLYWYRIYLISKWLSFNNITLFVDNKNSKKILNLLHDKLFYNK
jgi:aspartate kinase